MGQVFSLDRLKQTGKALKDVTVQGAIATKDGVVTATNATILAFILTKDAIMSVAWGPAKALFDEIWNQLDMHQSPGDHNMALFRACLDGEFKLVESALVHKKKLIYHWEDRYVELTDIPAGIWSESSDTAPLLVTKDYYPRGAEKMMQGGSCVPLKKGQIVHGYLDTNKKPKKTKFDNDMFWIGALEKGTVSWDTALYFPVDCIEPLALYKPNWQRIEKDDGRTALHAAAFEGHTKICDILLAFGWSCWEKNTMDPVNTPLDCARIGGHVDLYYHMVKQQPPPPIPEVVIDSDEDDNEEEEVQDDDEQDEVKDEMNEETDDNTEQKEKEIVDDEMEKEEIDKDMIVEEKDDDDIEETKEDGDDE